MNDSLQYLKAARGYLDMGMPQDAWDELEKLPPLLKDRDAVLDLQFEIHQRLGNWESAGMLAESLAKRSPQDPNWWLHWVSSLRQGKSVEAAQTVLMEAAIASP